MHTHSLVSTNKMVITKKGGQGYNIRMIDCCLTPGE